MYQRYAELQGWRFEIIDASEIEIGGYKEASAQISGTGVFARLKFESGAHRVQRVPVTEGSGRIHRSEEHTSELQSLMRISYAVFCLKQKKLNQHTTKKPTNKNTAK